MQNAIIRMILFLYKIESISEHVRTKKPFVIPFGSASNLHFSANFHKNLESKKKKRKNRSPKGKPTKILDWPNSQQHTLAYLSSDHNCIDCSRNIFVAKKCF